MRARVGLVSKLEDAHEYLGRCSLILTRQKDAPKRHDRAVCGGLDEHGRHHLGAQGVMAVWGPNHDEVAKFLRQVPPKLAILLVLAAKPKKGGRLETALARESKIGRNVRLVILKKTGDVLCVDCVPGGGIVDVKPADALNPSTAPSTPATNRKRVPPSKRRGWQGGRTLTEPHSAPNATTPAKASIPPRVPQAGKAATPPSPQQAAKSKPEPSAGPDKVASD